MRERRARMYDVSRSRDKLSIAKGVRSSGDLSSRHMRSATRMPGNPICC
jgi:hypothetical protein